jgi:hypothetical protein
MLVAPDTSPRARLPGDDANWNSICRREWPIRTKRFAWRLSG